MKIGVLALQGAFAEHRKMLEKLGIESFEIRKKSDLSNAVDNNDIDGLIIPGGESTVIGKLLYDLDLFDDIKKLILEGLPVFGTCAGLILLAKEIENDSRTYLGAMDIKVTRILFSLAATTFPSTSERISTFFPTLEIYGDRINVIGITPTPLNSLSVKKLPSCLP